VNTFGVAMLAYQRVNPRVRYTESHNDYLQIASEGGLLVGIPLLMTLAVFVRECRWQSSTAAHDPDEWIRFGAFVGLLGISVQSLFEFSLQMPGNAALFATLCAIAIHRPRQPLSRPAALTLVKPVADHRVYAI
jgi:O-antigen ligase